jgi:acetyl-CoA acetyltransferase
MSIYVLGVGMHPATAHETGLRLEEMVWATASRALEQAGVARSSVDAITLGACDEVDGRPISSMLMTAPAGGFQTDEMKVTESGLTALCLAYARMLAGGSDLALVASWCKSSKTDVRKVMRQRADPFYTRDFGLDDVVCDALFSQAVAAKLGIDQHQADTRTMLAYERAARNPRGMRHAIPAEEAVKQATPLATPLRALHRAPLTDGAVVMVLASTDFMRAHPHCRPMAAIKGVGWATDSYQLGRERLSSMRSARIAWKNALQQAGLQKTDDLDVVELDSQTVYHEAAYADAFGIGPGTSISPSGGPFAQNPFFCSGLVNAAEAVLQVSNAAGAVQVPGVRRAAAHGCDGFAQQGNAVVVFEQAEEVQ